MGSRQWVFQENWILTAVQGSMEARALKPEVMPDRHGPQV